MKLLFETIVNCRLERVVERFDRELFLSLLPAFPPVRLLRFDGCETGDEVHLKLFMLPKSQLWISRIIDHGWTEREFYFVDRGITLPFFLSSWEHRHRLIREDDSRTRIVDDISYRSSSRVIDPLIHPFLWSQFARRGSSYQRYFQ